MACNQEPEKDEPVYWFIILESAARRRDEAEIARAERELARLGVVVEFSPRAIREAVSHA